MLVQALAKGGRDEQAVETATELGVDEIIPWQAERSVVVWAGERGERSRQRWLATARAAAKQSRRAVVPVIREVLTTPQLAAALSRDRAGDEKADAARAALLLHEDADRPLAGVPLVADGIPGELLVLVGPEGGNGPDEVAALVAAGACPVRLGPHVLRTSSAGAAALAVLSARLHRWD